MKKHSVSTLILTAVFCWSLLGTASADKLDRETSYAKQVFEFMNLDPGKDGLEPRRRKGAPKGVKQWEFRAVQHRKTGIHTVETLQKMLNERHRSTGGVTFNGNWRNDVGKFYAAWVVKDPGEAKHEAWILTDTLADNQRKFRLVIEGLKF